MNKIRKNLYIGNARDVTLADYVKKAKITAILNVAYEVEFDLFTIYSPKEMIYVKVGLMDNDKNKTEIKVLAIYNLINLLKAGETVLVHCGAGLSRSVYVASKALAIIEGKDPDETFQDIRNERPFAMKGGLWHGEGYKPIGYEEEKLFGKCRIPMGWTEGDRFPELKKEFEKSTKEKLELTETSLEKFFVWIKGNYPDYFEEKMQAHYE